MKKKIFIGIIILIGLNSPVFCNTWELIKEKTWGDIRNFPTKQIIFYETVSNYKKAIYQIGGSGVCAVLSVIYDIELKSDTIFLKNGMIWTVIIEKKNFYHKMW